MKFSLIVSTRGRVDELKTLFRSLRDQTFQDFEIIVADQNEDDRLQACLKDVPLGLKISVFKSAGGVSKGRNQGCELATGEIFGFPDDDCAYVPRLLEEVSAFFDQHPEFGYLSGKSFADDGRDSVSRHAKCASEVRKKTIHSQCIEFAMFIRRSAMEEMGFDENMGVGSLTPWHSDEGPDLLLRMSEKGVRGFYEPQLMVWHPRPVTNFGPKDIDRTYRYACGNGYFYRKHGYSRVFFARQMARTTCGLLLALARFKLGRAQLYSARLRGRWRGWKAGPQERAPKTG